MKREYYKNKNLRYIYILEIDNKGKKSKFFGLKKIFYTGQTSNLINIIMQHLTRKYGFLGKNFPESVKKLVFVDYVYGTEYDAMIEEDKIKNMPLQKKIKLILSDRNKLIRYIPIRAILLKKYNLEDETVCLRFN